MRDERSGGVMSRRGSQVCHSVEFDWDGTRSLGEIVLTAVADASGRNETDLPILYDVVDADALSRMFRPRSGAPARSEASASFRYAGYRVTVHARGRVDVSEA